MSKYNVGDYFYCKKEDEAKAIKKLQSEGETVFNGHVSSLYAGVDIMFAKIYSEGRESYMWSRYCVSNGTSRQLKNDITSEFFGDDMSETKGDAIVAAIYLETEAKVVLGSKSHPIYKKYLELRGNDTFDNYIRDPDLDLKRQIAEKEKELEELKAKLKHV